MTYNHTKTGDTIKLRLQLGNSETTMFPQGRVYDSSGTEITGSPFNMTHVVNGLYKFDVTSQPAGEYVAIYRVFTDSGHTTANADYGRSSDVFEVFSVWDELTASHVTAGTFGLNIDATISSRAAAATALSTAQWTNTRASNLDNLDAAISTRAPSATALSTAQWTNTRAGNLDNLDAAISTRAPSATALSTAQWTNTRASNLDNLDATVSSRNSTAHFDAILGTPASTVSADIASVKTDTNTLTGRLTAGRASNLDNLDATISSRAPSATALSTAQWTNTRAANLDNLDVAVSTRAATADSRFANLDATISSRATQASVNAIQNNTNFAGIVPEYLVIPDSGSTINTFYVRLFNDINQPADPDSNTVNINIKDVAGANVVATTPMTRDGVGLYHYAYTVNSTDPARALYIFFTYSVSTIAFNQPRVTQVSPNQSDLDVLLSRLTAQRALNLDNLDATISSRATQTSVNAIPTNPLLTTDVRLNHLDVDISTRAPSATALSTTQWTNTRASNLDNLDATVSSRATQTSVNAIPTNPLLTTDVRLNDLDASISSRAPAATALSTAQWTNTRAGNLDNLDATVSSRATQTSVNAIPTNPLLTTDARVNHLDADISSRASQASVDALPTATDTSFAVWEELTSAHTTPGTMAEALENAGGNSPSQIADAVWNSTRSTHVVVGSFGEVVDAKISSRATQASVDTANNELNDIAVAIDKIPSKVAIGDITGTANQDDETTLIGTANT